MRIPYNPLLIRSLDYSSYQGAYFQNVSVGNDSVAVEPDTTLVNYAGVVPQTTHATWFRNAGAFLPPLLAGCAFGFQASRPFLLNPRSAEPRSVVKSLLGALGVLGSG